MSFGRSLRHRWRLDDSWTYLNQGTVGAPPVDVIDARRLLMDRIERQPALYHFHQLVRPAPEAGTLRQAAHEVASWLGADGDDLVFVDNTTTGIQAVLRSFPFEPGDRILVADIGYGAINKGVEWIAASAGLEVDRFEVELPLTNPDEVTRAVRGALRPDTRLVIVDHVNSMTGLVFPVADVIAACTSHRALVLVDGAHAPGFLPLHLGTLGADFYVGNLHKWAWAPRAAAVLWVAPAHQSLIHPTVISWELGQGFTREFDTVGTRDPSAFLTAPFAIEQLEALGLAERWAWTGSVIEEGIGRLVAHGAIPTGPASMRRQMGSVLLPPSGEDPMALKHRVIHESRVDVTVSDFDGSALVRFGAEVYNDQHDLDRLEEVLFGQVG